MGNPTAAAMIHTNKMVKMIGLWLPEVCAWEYSKGCLMARYLQKDIKGFGEIRKKMQFHEF